MGSPAHACHPPGSGLLIPLRWMLITPGKVTVLKAGHTFKTNALGSTISVHLQSQSWVPQEKKKIKIHLPAQVHLIPFVSTGISPFLYLSGNWCFPQDSGVYKKQANGWISLKSCCYSNCCCFVCFSNNHNFPKA